MAILENRVKTKNQLIELVQFALFSAKRFFVIGLIFITCLLLYFSSPQILSNIILEITGRTLSAGTLISRNIVENIQSINDKIIYFNNIEAENIRLKLKIAELLENQRTTLVSQAENEHFRKILNVVKDKKPEYLTAKIVGLVTSPFANSATLEAGSNQGVKINSIVFAEGGLVGRIIQVSPNYSTIMLISDYNSRIPVISGKSLERGIVAKQGDHLKLIYLQENHEVKMGEILYTSGDGKIYPHGIQVGEVEKITDEGVFISISTNLSKLKFVIIESPLDQIE